MQATSIATTTFNPKVRWWTDSEWLGTYDRFLTPDRRPTADHHRILDRRFTLQAFAASVSHLLGSTAECGVYRGTGSSLICATLCGTYHDEKHYGFDSFEGLPELVQTMPIGRRGNSPRHMKSPQRIWLSSRIFAS